MITSWRLCKKEATALSGEGAAIYGGRWNPKGVQVVYSAECLPLATLEAFVHLNRIPDNQVYVRMAFREGVHNRIEDLYGLPVDWKHDRAATRNLGSRWLGGRPSAVLSVPSAVVPLSRNYLINPNHPDFRLIECSSPVRYEFDDRLLSKLHL